MGRAHPTNPLRAAKSCRSCGRPIVLVKHRGKTLVLDLGTVARTTDAEDVALPGFGDAPARWYGRRVFGYVDGYGLARMRVPTPDDPDPRDEEGVYLRHDCRPVGGWSL